MCFFFNDTATTEIYTLSLHDALPICEEAQEGLEARHLPEVGAQAQGQEAREGAQALRQDARLGLRGRPRPAYPVGRGRPDRKSTRLNSSHANISYAVFCLKKKKNCAIPPCRSTIHLSSSPPRHHTSYSDCPLRLPAYCYASLHPSALSPLT